MEFEQQGWTKFTPHYLVWVCPDSYHQSAECKSQCIRQGRYCTPDPDGDIEKGYSGKDIVQARLDTAVVRVDWHQHHSIWMGQGCVRLLCKLIT